MLRGQLDQLDLKDHKESLVKRDLMEYKVYLVTKEVLAPPERQEHLEFKDLRDLLAKRVSVVLLELSEAPVQLVMLVELVLKVMLVTKVNLVSPEHPVNKD